MKVSIDLPEDVFKKIVMMQGTVKEVVENIVIEAIKGNKGSWRLKRLKEENKRLREKLQKVEEEKERLESLFSEKAVSAERVIEELRRENQNLKERLKESEKVAKTEIDYSLIGIAVRESVKRAFHDILKEYETAGFKLKVSFVERCRQVVVAVNKYLDSADEPVRLAMHVQNGELVLCEPKVTATFLDYYSIHPNKLKSIGSLIRELDPEIKVEVVESDISKGYILLKSNANGLRGE